MATHQVQLSLRRAGRRPRMLGCLAARAAVLGGLCAAAGSAATWTAMRWRGGDGPEVVGTGAAAVIAGMMIAAAFGGRLGRTLRDFTEAARQLASGDFRIRLPQGPTSEVGRLSAAFNHMATSLGADRQRHQELTLALEERVRERTAEAEARSRELESFLYAASHDLRAPVLSIQGFANLLTRNLGRRLDGQSRDHLQRIRTNAESMDLLLRDLLEVSRVGRVQEAVEWVDSGEVVASVLRDLEPEVARLGIRVEVSDRLPMVAYSPRLLARVFRNLVDNAIKFMGDQPSPRIRIACERLREGHRFWVQDNGVGISPEHHDNVFGLFTRADGAVAPGSGVGLAVVRRIVETHRGRVWVESERGAGSMFCFTVCANSPGKGGGDEVTSGSGGAGSRADGSQGGLSSSA